MRIIHHWRTVPHVPMCLHVVMKSMLKSELAERAGVSLSTFGRWLKRHTEELERMGVTPRSKVLPPIAVRYVCERYGIDITNP